MSVKAMLEEMLLLLKKQVEAVVAGDTEAVRTGAEEYERLLAGLDRADFDVPPEELQPLYDEIQREKKKLQSLLSVEANRVDFLLRLLVGSGNKGPVGYPGKGRQESGARMLNRRA